MAATATYDILLTVAEKLTLGLTDATNPTITHDLGDSKGSLDANSSIAISKAWSTTGNLSGGTATIDLTALPASNLPNITFSALKVKLIKITCPTTNTAGVVFDIGAASPYDIFGDANGQITVLPGQVYGAYMAEQLEDVDGTHKTLDLSSTDVDAAYSILIAAGG